jgi:hypothetical protein
MSILPEVTTTLSLQALRLDEQGRVVAPAVTVGQASRPANWGITTDIVASSDGRLAIVYGDVQSGSANVWVSWRNADLTENLSRFSVPFDQAMSATQTFQLNSVLSPSGDLVVAARAASGDVVWTILPNGGAIGSVRNTWSDPAGAFGYVDLAYTASGALLIAADDEFAANTSRIRTFSPDRIADDVGDLNSSVVLATLPDGGYAIAYRDTQHSTFTGGDISLRIFNADGSARTAPILVNAGPAIAGAQFNPAIAVLPNGFIAVTWDQNTTNQIGLSAFDLNGRALLQNVIVGGGFDSDIAILQDGTLAVLWDSAGSSVGRLIDIVREVIGDDAGDTYDGDALRDAVVAQGGNDIVRTYAGDDAIDAGAGDDSVTGGAGNDLIIGGAGRDISVYGVSSNAATFARTLTGEITVVTATEGADTLTGVELLQFSNRTLATRPSEGSLDGNGTSDILLRSGSGQLAAWSMTGASVTNAAIIGLLDPVYSQGLQGDFNGDGRFDYVARVPGSLMQVVLLNGSAATAAATYAPSASESLAGVGDFNGDGRDDILFRNTSGLMSQWQMDGTAPTIGTFATSDTSWTVASIADFNGDGKDDILWRNSSGLLATWTMDGFAVASAAVFAVSDPTWAIVGTGDFNGDLREDILWRSSGGVMAQWTMDGTTVTSVGTFAVSDPAWSVSDIGDYNGDGRDDILWQGPDGTFALWTLDGFAVTSVGLIGNPGGGWNDLA